MPENCLKNFKRNQESYKYLCVDKDIFSSIDNEKQRKKMLHCISEDVSHETMRPASTKMVQYHCSLSPIATLLAFSFVAISCVAFVAPSSRPLGSRISVWNNVDHAKSMTAMTRCNTKEWMKSKAKDNDEGRSRARATGKDETLIELLEELDRRDIPYPPTATRGELESLRLATDKNQRTPITDLLQELNQRGIRYSPVASRSDLEVLLQKSQSNDNSREVRVVPSSTVTNRSTVESPSVAKPPIRTLLNQLNQRNIRYASNASRAELEALLEQNSQKQRATSTRSMNSERGRNDRKGPPTRISVRELLQELDRRGIMYPASASRDQLESLLKKDIPIWELQRELEQNQIRHSPTASRVELEKLLKNNIFHKNHASPSTKTRKQPLRHLQAELDRSNIRYPSNSTQQELEYLLLQQQLSPGRARRGSSRQRNSQRYSTDKGSSESYERIRRSKRSKLETILKKTTFVASQNAQKLPRRISNIAKQTEIPSRLSTVAKRAKSATRRTIEFIVEEEDYDGEEQKTRNARENDNDDDDNIVREPDWYYVTKYDAPIDVSAEPMVDESVEKNPLPRRRRQMRRSRPRGSSSGAVEKEENVWQDPSSASTQRSRVTRQKQQWLSSPPYANRRRSPLQLPPTSNDTIYLSDTNAKNNSSETNVPPSPSNHRPRRRRSQPSDRNRKRSKEKDKPIYSNYNMDEPDAFDQFGELIANAAEEVLWGPQQDTHNSESGDTSTTTKRNKRGSTSSSRKSRYWKDRLAENFDVALGIHEYGNYYNSWGGKQEEDGKDAVSHFFARQERAKRPSPGSRLKRQSDLPFWQEEGSIFSLIFGRTPDGDKLTFKRFVDQDLGTTALTSSFRLILKIFFLSLGCACRWASVRGALPQPFVVAGVAAAAISARRRQKILATALVLIAMRTLGELMHGYMHGSEGWEDDDEPISSDDSYGAGDDDNAEAFQSTTRRSSKETGS